MSKDNTDYQSKYVFGSFYSQNRFNCISAFIIVIFKTKIDINENNY